MKISLLQVVLFSWVLSFGQVRVRGYYRKNGTYVQPHYRSMPDGNPYNNYSYPGNTNPYTGRTTPSGSSNNSGSYNRSSTTSGTSKTMYINTDRLAARTEPSSTSNIITILTYQSLVELIGTPNSTWHQVRFTFFDPLESKFRTVDGFIESAYLSSTFPDDIVAPRNHDFSGGAQLRSTNSSQRSSSLTTSYSISDNTWYVYTDKTIARIAPSNSANIVTTLKYKQLVEVLEITNSIWCKARFTYFDSVQSKYKTVNGYLEKACLTDEFPEVPQSLKESHETKKRNLTTEPSSRPNTIINLPIYPSHNNEVKNKITPYGQGNGRLIIWTNCENCSEIAIYINDNYAGTISKYYYTQPDCNSIECFSVTRSAGKIKLTAISASTGNKWEADLNIVEDKCVIQQLSK